MLINKISLLDVMRKTNSNSNNQAKQNIASLILDTDPFDISKLTELIDLGNNACGTEKAADLLETYLMASDDNTLMSAYFEIIEQYNKMFGFLKTLGYSMNEFKAEIESKTNSARKQMKENDNVQLDN